MLLHTYFLYSVKYVYTNELESYFVQEYVKHSHDRAKQCVAFPPNESSNVIRRPSAFSFANIPKRHHGTFIVIRLLHGREEILPFFVVMQCILICSSIKSDQGL